MSRLRIRRDDHPDARGVHLWGVQVTPTATRLFETWREAIDWAFDRADVQHLRDGLGDPESDPGGANDTRVTHPTPGTTPDRHAIGVESDRKPTKAPTEGGDAERPAEGHTRDQDAVDLAAMIRFRDDMIAERDALTRLRHVVHNDTAPWIDRATTLAAYGVSERLVQVIGRIAASARATVEDITILAHAGINTTPLVKTLSGQDADHWRRLYQDRQRRLNDVFQQIDYEEAYGDALTRCGLVAQRFRDATNGQPCTPPEHRHEPCSTTPILDRPPGEIGDVDAMEVPD